MSKVTGQSQVVRQYIPGCCGLHEHYVRVYVDHVDGLIEVSMRQQPKRLSRRPKLAWDLIAGRGCEYNGVDLDPTEANRLAELLQTARDPTAEHGR